MLGKLKQIYLDRMTVNNMVYVCGVLVRKYNNA